VADGQQLEKDGVGNHIFSCELRTSCQEQMLRQKDGHFKERQDTKQSEGVVSKTRVLEEESFALMGLGQIGALKRFKCPRAMRLDALSVGRLG
jgi:hypothetical protein